MTNTKTTHQPVLVPEVIRLLDPKPGESYFDGTAGYGGHAAPIIDRLGDGGRVILVDRDPVAVRALKERFGNRPEIWRANFLDAAADLIADSQQMDLILLDLGASSPQLDSGERGFSFKRPGPLDMRMDPAQHLTADEVVNHYPVQKLRTILADYGEEPKAGAVSRAIEAARPITDTTELARVIRPVAAPSGKTDRATRAFQAIRIEVNDELGTLEQALPILVRLLAPGGRLAVISFHSLEDRIVKQFFDRESRGCICPPKQPICTCGPHQATVAKLTKQAIAGSEFDTNPRARSAKLRAAIKLKAKQKEGK